jgi:fatty-acyl-CoA synthase
MNVVAPILFQARHDPPAPALCAPGTALGVVSYARLARFIHSVGHRAIRLGIAPGQVAAIHVKDHIFHTALALGLMHIGVATVSVSAALPPGLHVDLIVTDAPQLFGNGKNKKVVPFDLTWMSGKGVPIDDARVYSGNGEDICRIALTSGSTGEAKAVGFSHNNQRARLARHSHVFGRKFPECSRFFSDYGLASSGGFRHVLYALSRGGMMCFPGASPMETLQTFELYKVEALIASPGGLSGFLKFYEGNRDFHSAFKIIIVAGSPLPDSLSTRVRGRICNDVIFYYGTTETSTVSSAPAYALNGTVGAVGYIAPDVSVRVLDESGIEVEPGHEGTLRVRTPVSVETYLDDTSQIEMPFHDRYFDTGDIGYVTAENMLVITGRKNDVLNLGGDKVSPRVIEDTLTACHAIREAVAVAAPNETGIDEVWALVVTDGTTNEEGLRQHCRERLADSHVPVRFIAVTELPRNDTGKIDRRRLSELVKTVVSRTP